MVQLLTPEIVKRPLFASFVATLITILVAGGYYVFAQPEIPLFYTRALPQDTIAPKEWIFIFPTISFTQTVGHVIIVHFFRKYEPLLLILFVRFGLVIQIILLAALLRIMYITT